MSSLTSRLSSSRFGGLELLVLTFTLSVAIGLFLRGENTRVVVKRGDVCLQTTNPKLCRENLKILGKQRDVTEIIGPRITITIRPVRIISQTLTRTVNVPVAGPPGPTGATGSPGTKAPSPIQQPFRPLPSPPLVPPATPRRPTSAPPKKKPITVVSPPSKKPAIKPTPPGLNKPKKPKKP